MFRIPSAIALCATLALSGFVATAPAAAQDGASPSYVRIAMDRSKVVRIPRPAETVVVGNPEIADVVLQDDTTLVLTGKSMGETNLIILDEAGDPIVDETIVVAMPDTTTVYVFTPSGSSMARCAPDCAAISTASATPDPANRPQP